MKIEDIFPALLEQYGNEPGEDGGDYQEPQMMDYQEPQMMNYQEPPEQKNLSLTYLKEILENVKEKGFSIFEKAL